MAMGMTTKSQVKQPRTISTIFQEGLNIRIFDMMVKSHDDLHWFHHNFKMVNLLPVFVFNFNFMPKNKKPRKAKKTHKSGTFRKNTLWNEHLSL